MKKAITSGNAGVTQPGASGSPNIIGPDVIKMLAIKQHATACSKLKPSAITTGAPANAVAPAIIRPCRNSPVRNFICIKGILSVNGPHLIPLSFDTSLFTLIAPTFPLLNLLRLKDTFYFQINL